MLQHPLSSRDLSLAPGPLGGDAGWRLDGKYREDRQARHRRLRYADTRQTDKLLFELKRLSMSPVQHGLKRTRKKPVKGYPRTELRAVSRGGNGRLNGTLFLGPIFILFAETSGVTFRVRAKRHAKSHGKSISNSVNASLRAKVTSTENLTRLQQSRPSSVLT